MTKQTQHVENMYNFKYFFNILTYHKINNLLHTSIKLKNDQKIKELKELKKILTLHYLISIQTKK